MKSMHGLGQGGKLPDSKCRVANLPKTPCTSNPTSRIAEILGIVFRSLFKNLIVFQFRSFQPSRGPLRHPGSVYRFVGFSWLRFWEIQNTTTQQHPEFVTFYFRAGHTLNNHAAALLIRVGCRHSYRSILFLAEQQILVHYPKCPFLAGELVY